MAYRIAVASSDGINIDLHFAKASQFYIYDIRDDGFDFFELRKCDAVHSHSETEFDSTLETLRDCKAVVVSKVGTGALTYLSAKGLRAFEAPYPIEIVLDKMISKKILKY
ncbi:MAG TPA: NifB/NifX family molybdenum-iron cluster-binding protein [Ruminiclostridium sp.]|nr:NifB/NifX family molybdenum-iron cluster-binding protein [Ruminiclostridium sp.]